MLSLSHAQIDDALARPQLRDGLERYLWLQVRVANGNFEHDALFRRSYNRFYRVRRSKSWQDAYYGLMGRSARAPKKQQFPEVLHALYTATDRYEPSFASKLVATLDPEKPVIDRFVLKNAGLRLPSTSAHNRAERICEVYGELEALFNTFLGGTSAEYLITAFSRTYPDAGITPVKMLDLVLWQTRREGEVIAR